MKIATNRRHLIYGFLPLLALIYTFLIPATAQAQKATLRVQVRSQNSGAPLIGATVRLLSYKDKKLVYGSATNKYGVAGFHSVKPKKYWLVVSYIGFKTEKG